MVRKPRSPNLFPCYFECGNTAPYVSSLPTQHERLSSSTSDRGSTSRGTHHEIKTDETERILRRLQVTNVMENALRATPPIAPRTLYTVEIASRRAPASPSQEGENAMTFG